MNDHNFTAGAAIRSHIRPLTMDSLMKLVPSAFAEHAAGNTSDKYTYIPTHQIIEGLMGEGWVPVKAQQSVARILERKDFARHMIRFQRPDSAPVVVGDVFPEIILSNAHDGTSAYRMDAGLFRLACSNGMCVSDASFDKISIPHRGDIRTQVIEASYRVIERMPELAHEVKSFKDTMMPETHARAFANAALELKYPTDIDEESGKRTRTSPIEPWQIVQPRRNADRDEKNNLWGVFNMVQENLINGGVRGRSAAGRRTTTRSVKSVTEDLRLNKALWTLATEMRGILAGA